MYITTIYILLPYDPAITLLGICLQRGKNHYLEEMSALPCALNHYSQQPRNGNNLNIH